MYDIFYCYSNGSLVKALAQAKAFIEREGEDRIVVISSTHDEQLGWTIIVVYIKKSV